jgi:hypothetical protein
MPWYSGGSKPMPHEGLVSCWEEFEEEDAEDEGFLSLDVSLGNGGGVYGGCGADGRPILEFLLFERVIRFHIIPSLQYRDRIGL